MKKRHSFGLTIIVLIFIIYTFVASTTNYVENFKLPDQFTFKKKQNQFLNSDVQIGTKSSPLIVFQPKPLTTVDIFKRDHGWTATLSASKTTTIVATGDLIPARTTNARVVAGGNFDLPFQDTSDVLRKADIAITNLESPLIKGCPITNEGMSFCGDIRWALGMKNAGIDIATLENNHITNKGGPGVDQTIKALADQGIDFANRNKLLIRRIKDKNFGFLAFNGVGEKLDKESVVSKVTDSKSQVDMLIVSIHWGKEYTFDPLSDYSVAPDNPKDIAHLILDSGADLIIGNHPHWVQGLEIYNGKVVTYSHGNYIFDQNWSIETQEGTLAKYTFYENSLVDIEFIPTYIENQSLAKVATGEKRDKILNQIKGATERLMK